MDLGFGFGGRGDCDLGGLMGCEVWYTAIGSSMGTRWGTSFWFYDMLMASIREQGKTTRLDHSPK
jgi:hypothetical protein